MTTLTLIGEALPLFEAQVNQTATRDLALALAQTGPRGCTVELLLGRGALDPALDHPKLTVQRLPLPASALPVYWQSGTAARSYSGSLVHSLTPLAPLRTQSDESSQTTVTIPHALPWESPASMPGQTARLMRVFARRAVRHADLIVVPTHAVAATLRGVYGTGVPIRVVPLAAPSAYLAGTDARERRLALKLPERYLLTTASLTPHGRLDWILDALVADPELPDLVVVQDGAAVKGQPEDLGRPELAGRVHVVSPRDIADMGALISGAELLVQPQTAMGSGYTVYAALAAGVPTLHAGLPGTAELTLDGAATFSDANELQRVLGELCSDADARNRLSLLAEDRGRTFTWGSLAWHLWELHADL